MVDDMALELMWHILEVDTWHRHRGPVCGGRSLACEESKRHVVVHGCVRAKAKTLNKA